VIGLWLGLGLMAACEEDDPCLPEGRPTLEIGKGTLAFTPMAEEGYTIGLVHGPQGGYHVELAVRTTHLDGSDFAASVFRGFVDGEELAVAYPYLNLRCNEGEGTQEDYGILLIFDAQPEDLHLASVIVEAEAEDVSGQHVTAEGHFIIVDDTL